MYIGFWFSLFLLCSAGLGNYLGRFPFWPDIVTLPQARMNASGEAQDLHYSLWCLEGIVPKQRAKLQSKGMALTRKLQGRRRSSIKVPIGLSGPVSGP